MKLKKILLVSLIALLAISFGYSRLGGSQKDLRVVKLQRFLAKYPYSPLRGHEHEIIFCADKFGLDYRLYLAIAFAESTLGKRYIKQTSNLTGYNNGTTGFDSIYHNIYTTHELIGTKKYYKKYRRTRNIKDLVYIYKGVPPFDHYIRNMRFALDAIHDVSVEDVRETELRRTISEHLLLTWSAIPFNKMETGINSYCD